MKLRYKIMNSILGVVILAIACLGYVVSQTDDCVSIADATGERPVMQAVVQYCYGSPEDLQTVSVDKPVPADDEVLVRVLAASVNPLDWHYMRGSPYFMRLGSGLGAPRDPRFGVDFAGTVESAGRNVTEFMPGDEVFGGRSGAFAEYVLVPADRAIVKKPASVSFEQAAAVPIAAVTALQALRDSGKLQAGQKVLINGASGGVGTFAVQIAKVMGAHVSGVCSSRNVEMVESIGADHVFDYTRENYTQSGEEYDLIVDMVGNHSLLSNRQVLKDDGTYVMVGGPAGDWVGPLIGPLKMLLLDPFVEQDFSMILAELNKDDLTTIAEYLRAGQVTSVIDSRFAFSEIPAAIEHSENGHARGKIIINVAN